MPIYSGKPCPGVDHRIPCRKIPFFQKLLFSPIQEIHRHNFARLFAGMPVVSGKAATFRRNTLRQSDRGTGRISGYRHLYPSLPTERKMYPSAVPEAIRQLTHHRQSKSGQTRFCVCPLLIIIHQPHQSGILYSFRKASPATLHPRSCRYATGQESPHPPPAQISAG